jgi:hypothetical protein
MRLLLLAAALLSLTAPVPALGQAGVGIVAFPNSGSPAAQAPFLRGLALLHNFEYGAAAEAFRQAQAADPGLVLAYWGEAMTYNHPVWMEQDAAAARAVLARLGPTREARLARAKDGRERAWLEAVETLYGDGSKEERDQAYSQRMAALFAARPQDLEARAFYALSLLGLAHQGRDIPLYMRAAALLEEVFPANPHHPGVLHYLIHSFDDPAHAPLGVRAARLYGAVAPEAGHALHMTSHIFLALGQWEEVERANVQAMAVVDRMRSAAGKPAVHCGHYDEWLAYARFQQSKDGAAMVDACRADAMTELSAAAAAATAVEPFRSDALSWADMAIRQRIEIGRWDGAPPIPEGRYLRTRFTLAYADLLAAGGNAAKVRAARAKLQALRKAIAEAGGGASPEMIHRGEIVLVQAAGLEKLAAGDVEGGLAGLRAAAAAEAAIPAAFGPPMVEKPSAELLGDTLLSLGRKPEAAQAYLAALAAAPGRRLSLAGLAASR